MRDDDRDVVYERITDAHMGEPRRLHDERYRIASMIIKDGDVVLDAACGLGYLKDSLRHRTVTWVGVDKEPLCGNVVADLNTWEPDFDYRVFVGFETIEHLEDPSAYVKAAKRAEVICLSTPIVPTKHRNEFHVQDFTKVQVEELFSDRDILHYEEQAELYGVWVFV